MIRRILDLGAADELQSAHTRIADLDRHETHETCAVCRGCVGCGAARRCQLWCALESRS